MRIIIIGIIAEYQGRMVDAAAVPQDILACDLDQEHFHDTPRNAEVALRKAMLLAE